MKRALCALFIAAALVLPASAVSFTDVPDGAWYAAAVEAVSDGGVMSGTSSTTFSPDQLVTRGMVVTVLWRLSGSPAPAGASSFPDVLDWYYYADAVAWAEENGIASGRSDGAFGGGDTVTREQLVAFLYRYAGYKGQDTAQSGAAALDFADAEEISSWALEAVTWAVDARLLSGKTGNLLDPRGSATRAEVAQILMNFLENNR